MTTSLPDARAQIRPLAAADGPRLVSLLRQAGAPATYLGNAWGAGGDVPAFLARALGVYAEGALRGVCWFGGRANLLIVVEPGIQVDPAALAAGIGRHREYWRIALGPAPILAVLARESERRTRLLRTQLYCEATTVAQVEERATPIRLAVRGDLAWLVRAGVELNRADLGLEPEEVSERWVRDAARARMRAGNTFVAGPPGAPTTKLDLGSTGAAGSVIEGVFTEPAARGCGLAAGLVAAVCLHELRAGRPRVCLHVDRDNVAARACYARAGMREVAESGLLLLEA